MTPDLTVLGKIIGGGLPAAAYAGRARPDGADRARRRRLPGGHAVGQSARHRGRPGHAAPARRRRLRAARRLDRARSPTGCARRPRRAGVPLQVGAHAPACSRLLLRAPGRELRRTPRPATSSAYAAFCRALLDRGVYLPPSQFEAWFPSLAHTDEHVERTRRRGSRRVRGGRRSRVSVLRAVRGGRRAGARRPHAATRARARALRGAVGGSRHGCSCWRRSTRATAPLRRPRARSPAWTTTCACSPATRSTRSASRGSRLRGDLAAVAELSDLISLSAQAQAPGRPDLAEALWDASAAALSAGDRAQQRVARDRLPGPSSRPAVGAPNVRSATMLALPFPGDKTGSTRG